jgi:hypothetical protein
MDFENVNMILNLEARGIKGPVYMFETHDGDLEVMRFFNNAVSQPFSYSLMTGVYRIMPNGTDLTPFLNRGFNGMNFASGDNLKYYHTHYDSYENISLTTMQHYVDQVGALVEYFSISPQFSDMSAFDSNNNSVFFTLPFGILLIYRDTVAFVICILLLMLTGALLAVYAIRGRIKTGKALLWLLIMLGAILAGALLGLGISFATSFITGVPFDLVWMPLPYTELIIMWSSLVALAFLFCLLHKVFHKRFNRNEMTIGAMLLLSLIQMAVAFLMIEATFLMLIPLLSTLVFFLLSQLYAVRTNKYLSAISAALPMIVTLTVFLALAHILTLMLTIGSLLVVMLFFIIMTMPLLPLWRDEVDRVS